MVPPEVRHCGTVERKKTKIFLNKKLLQFQNNKMFACTKFRRNRSRDIDFRARKPPQKFDVKEVAFSQYHKKYFTRLYISRSLFILTNPLLAAMRIFSFFFQNNVRSSSKRIPPKKTKLHHMCYCDIQTMQTKFARFCQNKLWILN